MTTQSRSIAEEFSTEGFGIEHLPYASFTAPGSGSPALGVRIGDHVLPVRSSTCQSSHPTH
jgi:hypothetical protein